VIMSVAREVKNVGTVICIGEGSGISQIYPVAKEYKQAGNRIMGIIGGRSKDSIILEEEMKSVCDELFITTVDGSYGRKGKVSDVLKELFEVIEKSTHTKYPDLVYNIASASMIKSVSELTSSYGIKAIAKEENV